MSAADGSGGSSGRRFPDIWGGSPGIPISIQETSLHRSMKRCLNSALGMMQVSDFPKTR
jgi:hypothetical protein